MGQVLHGSATTTEAVRRAIQRSEESVRALARRYSIKPDNGAEMAEAGGCNRQADGAYRATFVGSQH